MVLAEDIVRGSTLSDTRVKPAASPLRTVASVDAEPETEFRLIWRREFGAADGLIIRVAGDVPLWLPRVATKLQELLSLPESWDGYRARRVKPEAGRAALLLLIQIMQPRTPVPIVAPINDGGIKLAWNIHDIDLEIDVNGSGTHEVAYYDDRTGNNWERQERSPYSGIREAVRELTSRG